MTTKRRKADSSILASVHEAAAGLHGAGIVDGSTMHEFDALCTDVEKGVRLDSFVEKMGQPGPDEEAFFARRRQLGRGIGLDAAGDLVNEKGTSNA